MPPMYKKKPLKSLVEKGVIRENCPSRTAKEWLELLVKKSNSLGHAISWREIKGDPDLNHDEITEKLGFYSEYEHKLPGYQECTRRLLKCKIGGSNLYH